MGCGASTPGNGQGMTPVLEAKQEQDGKPAEPSRSNGTGAVQQAAEPEAPETEQPELQQPSSGPRQDPACLADAAPVWDCAVSLSWLQEFAQTVPEHYTTADVTELLVKPATLSSRCRYVDLVRPADPRAVGRAAFFVSHRWGCRFKGQLVAPLVQHLEARGRRGNGGGGGEGRAERQEEEGHQGHQAEEEQEEQEQEVYVWLDIFAVNQHPATSQQDDLANLHNVVRLSAATLMVLDPEALVLTRIWCLYEAWKTAEHHGSGGLQLLAYGFDFNGLRKTFIELDVERAEATVQADRDRILADIHSSMGAPRLNMYLKDAIVGSAQAEAERLQRLYPHLAPPPPATPPPPEPGTEQPAGGQAGTGGDGSSGGETAVVAAADTTGMPSTDGGGEGEGQDGGGGAGAGGVGSDGSDGSAAAHELAEALSRAGRLLMFAGRLPEAEPYLRRALTVADRAAVQYGNGDNGAGGASGAAPSAASPASPVHDVASHADALAVLLKSQRRWGESEALFRRALAAKEAALGSAHPEVLTLLNNLGSLMQDMERHDDAEALLRRVVASKEGALGPHHTSLASSLANLGLLLQRRGRLAEAEPLCRRALSIDEAAYGGQHPEVAADLNNLASLLKLQGKAAEAETTFRRALAAFEAALGPHHTSVATACWNLAALVGGGGPGAGGGGGGAGQQGEDGGGRRAEAAAFARRAHGIFVAALGEGHAYTVRVGQLVEQLEGGGGGGGAEEGREEQGSEAGEGGQEEEEDEQERGA